MNLIDALSNPFYSSSFVLGNLTPGFFRKRYVNKSKKFGLDGKYFILSFDCDTEKDIEVVEDVNKKLIDLNISASYAVPGEPVLVDRLFVRDRRTEYDAANTLCSNIYLPHFLRRY